MYVVYWKFTHEGKIHTLSQDFDDLGATLKKCEILRGDPRASFICTGYENPNMVGKQGVDVTGPDYDWKVRKADWRAYRR